MKLLEGKVAVVTGAARGIGKAIALQFAKEGANVAFTDLAIDENGKATEAEIAAGSRVLGKDYPTYVALSALPVTRTNLSDAWQEVYHDSLPSDIQDLLK